MIVAARLTDLADMHPRLLWDEIAAACALVLGGGNAPTIVSMDLQELPAFGSATIELSVTTTGISSDRLRKLQRTYESPRLIELAAIAIAGFGLYYGGGHEIRDVALRGSSADYLVDEASAVLEVAGRSRKNELEKAWLQRRRRLSMRWGGAFYLCVAEFETRSGRLAYLR
jgi:hypothetical protein